MMEKRTKLWRRKQGFRVFKARMVYHAAFQFAYYDTEGNHHEPLHWFELAKEHWTNVYRSTGTPCSCWMCSYNKYNRLDYKRETRRIIKEFLEI